MARCIAFLSLVVLLLGGCTLVDQRTFRSATVAAPPPASPNINGALITIDFETANPVYEGALREAVDQALARKPTVTFDVVTVVPATGTVGQQADAAGGIRADARDVARIIGEQGVDPERVQLMARSDPSVSGRQVQVFVH